MWSIVTVQQKALFPICATASLSYDFSAGVVGSLGDSMYVSPCKKAARLAFVGKGGKREKGEKMRIGYSFNDYMRYIAAAERQESARWRVGRQITRRVT